MRLSEGPFLNFLARVSAGALYPLCGVAGERSNLVRIELSSNLPQELRQIVEYCLGNESQTFGKMDFNTCVKNWTFIMGLWETGWGKMSAMTVGSFHVFIEFMTLTRVLKVRVHVFPKTLIFTVSVQAIYFSLGDRYVRRLYSRI